MLYGYNTDGIYITTPKVNFKAKKSVAFKTSKIRKAYTTDSHLAYTSKGVSERITWTFAGTMSPSGVWKNTEAM